MSRRPAKLLALALGAMVLLIGARPSRATTMLYYGTEKLLEDCSFVVVGQVETVEFVYHDERFGFGSHEIYTLTTIIPSRSWRWENPQERIVIEEIGGVVGRRVSTVDGLPHFSPGEEVLVFVEQRPDGHYKTFGMFLGAFRAEEAEGRLLWTRPQVLPGTTVVPSPFNQELAPMDAQGRIDRAAFLEAIDRSSVRKEGGR